MKKTISLLLLLFALSSCNKTTQIYGKIRDKLVQEQVSKVALAIDF